jgi:hypothetical protein
VPTDLDLACLTPEELRLGREGETYNEFLSRMNAVTPEREALADKLDGYS